MITFSGNRTGFIYDFNVLLAESVLSDKSY